MAPTEVVVHPLVLLSVVDHYNRVAKNTRKRVVGILLGEEYRGQVDITNSFAVPFEEDINDAAVWYLDHNYLETMANMFKKVTADEKIVGFYSTGPKIRESDLSIENLFRKYCPNPVLAIIDVRPELEGLPVQAYVTVEDVDGGNLEAKRKFTHIPSSIGAYDAEEVGVEHLLRDINDPSVSALAAQVKQRVTGLAGLQARLEEIDTYLGHVLAGRAPVNNLIVYNLQDIFNLLPNLNSQELVSAFLAKTNDMHTAVYLASLVRSIMALHDLVNNKIKFKDVDEVTGESLAAATTAAPAPVPPPATAK